MKQSELKSETIEKERPVFAAMIAFYVGSKTEGGLDSIFILNRCCKIADEYDFDLVSSDAGWVIDTEKAREDAERFAEELIRDFC